MYYANTLQVQRNVVGKDEIFTSGNIIPTANNTYQLGSTGAAWKEIVMGPGTLQIVAPSSKVASIGADDDGVAYISSGMSTQFVNVASAIDPIIGAVGGWRIGPTGIAGSAGFDLVAQQLKLGPEQGVTGPVYSLINNPGPTGLTGSVGPTGITGVTGPIGPLSTQVQVVDISGVVLGTGDTTINTITFTGLETSTRYAINWFVNETGTAGGNLNSATAYLTATNVASPASFRACDINFPVALNTYDLGGIHRISGSVVDTITTTSTSVVFTLQQTTNVSYTTNGRFSIQITKSL
jgi:hypothetical protein